jgi:hypothetical protein
MNYDSRETVLTEGNHMNSTPKWIPLLFGSAMILMAAIILGAFVGIIPTEGGQFLAPPIIIVGLGLCLLSGGIAMYIPQKAPVFFRSGLFAIALVSLAIVCNWTAFAPGVVYSSSTSIGLLQFSGEDPIGGRIVFGLAAIVVDLFMLFAVVGWIRYLRSMK